MKRCLPIAVLMGLAACSKAPEESTTTSSSAEAAPATLAAPEASRASEEQPAIDKAATSAPASCDLPEKTIFACTVTSGKMLSVCGLKDGGVQYRFGPEGAPELVLDGGIWASVPYSGGGEAQIKFENEEASYVVFSRIIRTNFKAGEPNNPKIEDGVSVYKGGDMLAMQMCDTATVSPVDVELAQQLLPEAEKLFTPDN